MVIMVLNSGSPSIKFQLIETENDTILCKGLVERIGLEILGIELDEDENTERKAEIISKTDSKVKVLVVPTEEERMIALEIKRIVESLGEVS